MNNVFKIISTMLIIFLILILVWVLINYYEQEPYFATPSTPVVKPVLDDNNQVTEIENDENIKIDELLETIDTRNDEENENQIIEQDNKIPTEPTQPIVMTSSEKTSNTEKQEVLDEIDKALMDLLQVVDKVKPVDESRLGVEESEVQQ